MPLPTDYESDERRDREAARIEREIDKADHDRDRKKDQDGLIDYGSNAGIRCDTDDGPCACGAWHGDETKQDHGPQKRPASVRQIEAGRKSLANNLTDHDWLQIEQAAAGCCNSGTSDEWPALRLAIENITGRPFGPRRTASWMQGFCEGVMIQAGRRKGKIDIVAEAKRMGIKPHDPIIGLIGGQ